MNWGSTRLCFAFVYKAYEPVSSQTRYKKGKFSSSQTIQICFPSHQVGQVLIQYQLPLGLSLFSGLPTAPGTRLRQVLGCYCLLRAPHQLCSRGTSLVIQQLGIHLPIQGTWIWSLVWELRSQQQGKETYKQQQRPSTVKKKNKYLQEA